MVGIIIVVVIVLFVLFKIGIFRKPTQCEECGKSLKGTEQQVFGKSVKMILCKDCAAKIHPQIMKHAKENWNYELYKDYLDWEKETADERYKFNPDVQYGTNKTLKIDTERGLFSIDSPKVFKDDDKGIVLRYADLLTYFFDFKPEEVKEGILRDKVKGDEYAVICTNRPSVVIEEKLNLYVSYPLKKRGIIETRYEYQLSKKFLDAIDSFITAGYLDEMRRKEQSVNTEEIMEQISKAAELFELDDLAEATKKGIKAKRDAMIKSPKPAAGEDNASFIIRVNEAYDILNSLISE